MVELSNPFDRELAARIEHTCLKPDATSSQILQLCKEAKHYGFAAVCVNPLMVSLAVSELSGSGISVASVANFPLGQSNWKAVEMEISESCAAGSDQVDLVLPLQHFIENKHDQLCHDIQTIRTLIGPKRRLKCIVEMSLLDKSHWKLAFEVVRDSGADMFKTGTGFFGGVRVEMVEFLRSLDPSFPIKASGGISSRNQANELLRAGATVLGTSRSVEIITNS